MDKFKTVALAILKAVKWKTILVTIYRDAIRPEIAKAVADSATKWDDLAFTSFEYLVDKFLADKVVDLAQADEAAKFMKAKVV